MIPMRRMANHIQDTGLVAQLLFEPAIWQSWTCLQPYLLNRWSAQPKCRPHCWSSWAPNLTPTLGRVCCNPLTVTAHYIAYCYSLHSFLCHILQCFLPHDWRPWATHVDTATLLLATYTSPWWTSCQRWIPFLHQRPPVPEHPTHPKYSSYKAI
jgi:hypothetical protein